MDEQRLQFRVGLLVIASLIMAGVLVVRFGEIEQYFDETYALAVVFDEAPGVHPGTPVQVNGVQIGRVRSVLLDPNEAGVLVVLDLNTQHQLRKDSRPEIVRSILGDSTIQFSPGKSNELMPPNMKLKGAAPVDPFVMAQRMEARVNETLASFHATSREWEAVGRNLNELMQTERGSLQQVIENTAVALDDFAKTMQAAHTTLSSTNSLVNDPEIRESVRETVAALPDLVTETRDTIAAAKTSIQKVNENLDKVNSNLHNVEQATAPLAEHSRKMVARMDNGLIQLESLLTELNTFATLINEEDGSLQQFVSNPRLYQNLERSTAALNVLLENLEPTLRDARIFADKVARHPEVLGVRGMISGSSGLKEVSEVEGPGTSR